MTRPATRKIIRHLVAAIGVLSISASSVLRAASWSQFQGDAAHSGHIDATINAQLLHPLWTLSKQDLGAQGIVGGVVTSPGRIYLTAAVSGSAPYDVIAVNAQDKSVSWRTGFAPYFGALSEPSFGNQTIYVHQWGHSGISGGNASQYPYVWGLDAATGAKKFGTSHSGQWSSGSRPTVDGNQVFAAGGYYGGLDAYDSSSGSREWFANVNQQYGWIPAADANRVYVYMGSASASPGPQTGTLFGYDRSSGARTVSIVNGDDRFTTYNGTPFVGGQNDVLAFTVGSAGYTLVSFNVANNSVNWRTPGNFSSYLAVDDGLLFVPNGIELTVLSESTGSQLQHWFAPPGESLDGNLVVTDNIVFVATSGGSYGIDRSSMQTVWHSTIKGELAFGDGMLLITNPNAVYAFAVPEAPSFVLAIVPIAALIGLRRRRSC